MAFENCIGHLKITLFYELCRTLQGLSKMVLVNAIAFAVLKILHNLVCMQKFCLQVTTNQTYQKRSL